MTQHTTNVTDAMREQPALRDFRFGSVVVSVQNDWRGKKEGNYTGRHDADYNAGLDSIPEC